MNILVVTIVDTQVFMKRGLSIVKINVIECFIDFQVQMGL